MATHSTVLAWRIPGTEEPGGLLSMGSHRVGHDWSDLAAAAALYEGEHKGEWNEGLLSLGWIGKKVNPERGWKMGKSRRGRDREQEWRKNRQIVTETENRKDRKLWAKTEIVSLWWQISGQFSSVAQLRLTLWPCGGEHVRPPCPSPTPGVYSNSCSLSRWWPSNHLILCCPLLLLLSIFPSIRVFTNESVLRIKWPKYWSFSYNISPFNEYSGLISFKMDWFDLLGVQGTLKSLLQHHSSEASILWRLAFFMVQLSSPYMTTGKTIALARRTFVDKIMSLLFNMLFTLVITFLPRSKCLFISWLQSPSAMI